MIKKPWIYNGEKTASSTTGIGKTGQLHEENETGLLSNSIHKSKLKMNQRPECKSWNHKTLRKKHRQKSLGHRHDQLLNEHISPDKENKSKIEQVGLKQTKKLLYSKGHHQ